MRHSWLAVTAIMLSLFAAAWAVEEHHPEQKGAAAKTKDPVRAATFRAACRATSRGVRPGKSRYQR